MFFVYLLTDGVALVIKTERNAFGRLFSTYALSKLVEHSTICVILRIPSFLLGLYINLSSCNTVC